MYSVTLCVLTHGALKLVQQCVCVCVCVCETKCHSWDVNSCRLQHSKHSSSNSKYSHHNHLNEQWHQSNLEVLEGLSLLLSDYPTLSLFHTDFFFSVPVPLSLPNPKAVIPLLLRASKWLLRPLNEWKRRENTCRQTETEHSLTDDCK